METKSISKTRGTTEVLGPGHRNRADFALGLSTALRQAEGFLRSLLELMDLSLEAPDHTTLSRRSKDLRVDLGLAASQKPIHLVIDSTGLSIVGDGEWAAAKHGKRGKRGWRILHIEVNQAGVIEAQILTDSSGDDNKTAVEIIKKALTPDGRVVHELRRPFRDGTTHFVFEPLVFIERLAGLPRQRRPPRLPLPRSAGPRTGWLH